MYPFFTLVGSVSFYRVTGATCKFIAFDYHDALLLAYGTFIHDTQLANRLGQSAKRHSAGKSRLWRSCSTWRLNFSQLELQGANANWGLLGSNGGGLTSTSVCGERWVCMSSITSGPAMIANCGSEQQVVDSSRGFTARYLGWRIQ